MPSQSNQSIISGKDGFFFKYTDTNTKLEKNEAPGNTTQTKEQNKSQGIN